jgi:hypothetical protein
LNLRDPTGAGGGTEEKRIDSVLKHSRLYRIFYKGIAPRRRHFLFFLIFIDFFYFKVFSLPSRPLKTSIRRTRPRGAFLLPRLSLQEIAVATKAVAQFFRLFFYFSSATSLLI